MSFIFSKPPRDRTLHSLRTSAGTRINRNRFTRAILRHNMCMSRMDGFAVQEIAKAYQVSTRTAWLNTKGIREYAEIQFRRMVKLVSRAKLTIAWIRWRILSEVGSLQLILSAIDAGERPP